MISCCTMSRLTSMTMLMGLVFLGFLELAGCRTTPLTGRRQIMLVPEQHEITMGEQGYQEILNTEKISSREKYKEIIERVGHRIAAVAGRPDYKWEFNLIESANMNAFALPGGKVAVYEGLLDVCQNEAGLAVVMSHEVAHVLARHGGERMSQTALINSIQKMIETSTKDKEAHDRELVMAVYGAASQYGISLPFSRHHESEADQIGLMLMADAGYDPREAPRFWERFAAAQGTEKPIEFLSTHPSDERRASDLRKLIPEAVARYEKCDTKIALGEQLTRPENLESPVGSPPGNVIQASGETLSGSEDLNNGKMFDH